MAGSGVGDQQIPTVDYFLDPALPPFFFFFIFLFHFYLNLAELFRESIQSLRYAEIDDTFVDEVVRISGENKRDKGEIKEITL